MNTKTKVILSAFLMSSLGMFSQVKFGVQAGTGYYMVPQSATNGIVTKMNSISPEVNQLNLQYPQTGGFGYQFGLFLDIALGESFGVMIEPSVSLRNYNEVNKSFSADTLSSVITENYIYNKLTYLDLPILFKLNLDPNTGKYGRKSFFSIFAGPQVSMFLGKSEINETTTSVTIYDQTTVSTVNSSRPNDFKLEYNTINIAFVAGGMYDFEKGLRIGARYVGSLMPVTSTINFDAHHHSFQVSVGYNFIPKKKSKRRR